MSLLCRVRQKTVALEHVQHFNNICIRILLMRSVVRELAIVCGNSATSKYFNIRSKVTEVRSWSKCGSISHPSGVSIQSLSSRVERALWDVFTLPMMSSVCSWLSAVSISGIFAISSWKYTSAHHYNTSSQPTSAVTIQAVISHVSYFMAPQCIT